MSNLPLFIILGVAAYMVFVFFQRAKATKDANERYAHMGAREVAARLGLSVVGGDPELNLMMLHHTHVSNDMAKRSDTGLLGTNVSGKSHGVTLEGTPNGRRQSFHYSLDSELERDNLVGGGTWTRTLRFGLTTQVKAPFPDFEVVLRAPNAYLRFAAS